MPFVDIVSTISRGARYLLLDIMAVLTEQAPCIILGVMATRADLGRFRLCQQTLSAAENPGWSYVQSKYPELTYGGETLIRACSRRMRLLGGGAFALCVAGSLPLAIVAFRRPSLAIMMIVVCSAVVFRYPIYFYDQLLRACGRMGPAMILAPARLIASCITMYLMIRRCGVWGAAGSTPVIACVFAGIYAIISRWASATREPLPALGSEVATEV
jgi:O-antigen/teichoic acid export membrane protein